jgi:hypothetical protein
MSAAGLALAVLAGAGVGLLYVICAKVSRIEALVRRLAERNSE